MTKPNKDGWIRHRGGKCPVDDGAIIDVRLANGDIYKGDKAMDWGWNHEDCMREFRLMAWRPHKPDIESLIQEGIDSADAGKLTPISEVRAKLEKEVAEKSSEAEMPAAKYFDSPIQWRDRIREIDAAAKEEEARHCAAMEAYDAERSSLVAKLKAEGFALIQGDEPNSEVESAQDDIAHPDMSDPANWRAGDMIISLEEEEDISIGGTYHITEIYGNDVIFRDNAGDERNRCASDYKWHSRPTT